MKCNPSQPVSAPSGQSGACLPYPAKAGVPQRRRWIRYFPSDNASPDPIGAALLEEFGSEGGSIGEGLVPVSRRRGLAAMRKPG